jgi:hypothetical protein
MQKTLRLPQIDQNKLIEICRLNDAVFLAVFGSSARADADAESDVDLLIRFSKRKSLLDLVRIERELSETVGRKVDLLTEASISPYLQERIHSEMAVLYEASR